MAESHPTRKSPGVYPGDLPLLKVPQVILQPARTSTGETLLLPNSIILQRKKQKHLDHVKMDNIFLMNNKISRIWLQTENVVRFLKQCIIQIMHVGVHQHGDKALRRKSGQHPNVPLHCDLSKDIRLSGSLRQVSTSKLATLGCRVFAKFNTE